MVKKVKYLIFSMSFINKKNIKTKQKGYLTLFGNNLG